ncbi:hypothetical protein NQ315_015844 [Exocentrus adspersus]|uniref:Uncharacterized protein n=1 Tax=Exocentrus adspersus TaxID=1586481 RepID=A0AAV8W3N0_9CUCU|nr:hypothetical protein NQ315_015844 [Exocentrus adspersus]
MEAEVDPLPSIYGDLRKYQGDDGDRQFDVAPAGSGRGVVLQQQWVTLTASMWPEPTAASPRGWKVSAVAERLPVLAAVFCGAALVVCLLCAFLFYRCCIMSCPGGTSTTDSDAAKRPSSPNRKAAAGAIATDWWPPVQPSPWYTPRMIGGPQCTQCPGVCPVPRSSSNPGSSSQVQPKNSTMRRQRPVSQPIPSNVMNGEIVPKAPLPEISEFSPNSPQYASSSILDEVGAKDEQASGEPTLKTRSLPAWVRSKPRPLSTEDDINDLYAKVNFSKKRKNRMRNDEAAIIALSKSRSQFLHKDTDSLVDNEAVIVYDERTAL